jgi:glycosyltransferase involved in cell wall biosynthesis
MEVSRRLAATGVDVAILCADSSGPALIEETHEGVPIRSVRHWPANRDYFLAPRIWSEIGRGEPWDLIHVQSYHTLVPPLAMIRALRLGIPYVLTFHGGGHSSRLRHGLRGVQRRALRPLLARADRLVAVARFEIDLYSEELRLPRERFALIPNGTDIEFSRTEDSSSAGRRASGKPMLASIGRLERYKGHQRVIAALPHVLRSRPEVQLSIVGTGPYEQELRRQAAGLGISAKVHFTSLPAEDRAGMAELLRQTAVVVLLSDFETHPLVALETVAAGRPLIVLDRAGLGEVARDGLARAVSEQDSPEAIGRAILAELEQPLRRQAVQPPSWDDCAASLLELYRSILR